MSDRKVYCRDCRFCGYNFCQAEDEFTGTKLKDICNLGDWDKHKVNKVGICHYYKRKWWKFWRTK